MEMDKSREKAGMEQNKQIQGYREQWLPGRKMIEG